MEAEDIFLTIQGHSKGSQYGTIHIEDRQLEKAAAKIASLCKVKGSVKEATLEDLAKTNYELGGKIECVRNYNEKLLAQLAKMREYATHKPYCDIEVYGGEVFEGMAVHCTCGFKEILSATPTDLEEKTDEIHP